MKIRTKICGITRPEDAQSAADAGADAVGLVFYAKSKCAVTAEQLRSEERRVGKECRSRWSPYH